MVCEHFDGWKVSKNVLFPSYADIDGIWVWKPQISGVFLCVVVGRIFNVVAHILTYWIHRQLITIRSHVIKGRISGPNAWNASSPKEESKDNVFVSESPNAVSDIQYSSEPWMYRCAGMLIRCTPTSSGRLNSMEREICCMKQIPSAFLGEASRPRRAGRVYL